LLFITLEIFKGWLFKPSFFLENMGNKECIEVSPLEKILVNFALPTDFLYHTAKSYLVQDEYRHQSLIERIHAIYHGKVEKYQKLLAIKQRHGEIPERIKRVCRKTPCGYARLVLAYLRNV